jgi:hypothetical protein
MADAGKPWITPFGSSVAGASATAAARLLSRQLLPIARPVLRVNTTAHDVATVSATGRADIVAAGLLPLPAVRIIGPGPGAAAALAPTPAWGARDAAFLTDADTWARPIQDAQAPPPPPPGLRWSDVVVNRVTASPWVDIEPATQQAILLDRLCERVSAALELALSLHDGAVADGFFSCT